MAAFPPALCSLLRFLSVVRASRRIRGRTCVWLRSRVRSGARVRLLHELERAGAAQDASTLFPGACALGVFELGLDVVAVIVALHGENAVRVVLGDRAFGGKFGVAVVRDFAFDHQVAWSASSPCCP